MTVGKELLSDRVQNMAESATIAMAQLARELVSQGIDIVSLSLGEPDFETPKYINDSATKAMEDGFTHYPPVAGYPDLRQAIAHKLQRDNAIECTADNIVVSTGAKQSIANTILSLINPGDEVIILAPYWVSYKDIVEFAKGVPVLVQGSIENDFKATAADIQKAISPRTKAVMFSSPSNPAGSLFSEEELKEIIKVVPENILFIADEIYEYINYVGGHVSIGALEGAKERTITINGFSKGFAMTGWRIGYICAPVWFAKATTKIQGQFTSGANTIAQKAALEAYQNLEQFKLETERMLAAYKKRKDLILKLVREIPSIDVREPQGAFYIFPDVSAYLGKTTKEGKVIKDTLDLSLHLLNSAHVSMVTGKAFGAENNLRISFATSEEQIIEGIRRMKNCLLELK